MTITSPAFEARRIIPIRYTCDGANVSPPLTFSGAPASTQSLVLILDDPDAPRGSFIHWMIWSISPDTKAIAEGSVPRGAVQGRNSTGESKYTGPCPPPGQTHQYHFRLYALDALLSLSPDAEASAVLKAMSGHVLQSAELVGMYQRT